MHRYLLLYIYFIFKGGIISGQKFVNEFLNIGVGARAHGMFGSVVASVNDGTAAYWNTAGLTDIENPLQINAMHAKWFGGIANYDYVSVAKNLIQQINLWLLFIYSTGSRQYSQYTESDRSRWYCRLQPGRNFSASRLRWYFSYAEPLAVVKNCHSVAILK